MARSVEEGAATAYAFFLPENLNWTGSLNSAILARFGQGLDQYILESLARPRRGDAFGFPPSVCPAPRLVFGILPPWDGGLNDEERLLKKCIGKMIAITEEMGCESLCLPGLGLESRDYPPRKAARLILNTIGSCDFKTLTEIRILCKTDGIFDAYKAALGNR